MRSGQTNSGLDGDPQAAGVTPVRRCRLECRSSVGSRSDVPSSDLRARKWNRWTCWVARSGAAGHGHLVVVFQVALWYPACFIIACEVIEVRRGVYVFLVVFLVQLSGLRALCAPSPGQTHDCCPKSTNTTLPSPFSLPDCCVISLLNCQGSISEAPVIEGLSECSGRSAAVLVPSSAVLVTVNRATPQLAMPFVSPPLSPHCQTCLLRI